MTVLRSYRAHVLPTKVEEYEAFERNEGVPMVASMPGCIRAGFARVRESKEPTYVFFSLWTSQHDLERARSTQKWKDTAGKLETLALTQGGDVAEHWDVRELKEGPAASPRNR